jgi:hypothetical protein
MSKPTNYMRNLTKENFKEFVGFPNRLLDYFSKDSNLNSIEKHCKVTVLRQNRTNYRNLGFEKI